MTVARRNPVCAQGGWVVTTEGIFSLAAEETKAAVAPPDEFAKRFRSYAISIDGKHAAVVEDSGKLRVYALGEKALEISLVDTESKHTTVKSAGKPGTFVTMSDGAAELWSIRSDAATVTATYGDFASIRNAVVSA